jgi:DNA invertase Pin-like site-specific DNA recombinase
VKRQLPASLEAINGLRAALWVRESTSGQFDAFGPEAQREQYRIAVERFGLTSTGIEWQVAHSGRTIGTTAQFADMIARAGKEYDILVVGYVSRFTRNVKTAFTAREDLHAAGAAILFSDERILSSDDRSWDSWARETVEAESYSRKLSRRISEGFASKKRILGEPGGEAPYGYTRAGKPPVLVEDPEEIAIVREAFSLAAKGRTNREIAQAVGLKMTHVAEIVRNPIYVGVMTNGQKTRITPAISQETWDQIRAWRGRFDRSRCNTGNRKPYVFSPMLKCGFCNRQLTGDSGQYRHKEACAESINARGGVKHGSTSYMSDAFMQAINEVIVDISLDDRSRSVVRKYLQDEAASPDSNTDQVAAARIRRQREDAAKQFVITRNVDELQTTLARLDDEEAALSKRVVVAQSELEALRALESLPALWRDADDRDKQLLAQQIFDGMWVKGSDRLEVRLTPWARSIGLQAAWKARGGSSSNLATVGGTGLPPAPARLTVVLIDDDAQAEEMVG